MRLALLILFLASPCFAGGNAAVCRDWSRKNIPNLVVNLKSTWTTSSSGAVSAIADLSGGGHHADQTTANRKPLLVAGELNGFPAVCAEGTNNNMALLTTTMGTVVQNSCSNLTAIVVCSTTNGFGNTVLCNDGAVAGSDYEMVIRYGDGNAYIDFGNATTARISGANTATGYHVWVMTRIGLNAYFYKDGAAILSSTTLSTGALSTTDQMYIFSRTLAGGNVATYPMRGGLVEMVLLNNGLTPAQITNVTRMVAANYNITVQ